MREEAVRANDVNRMQAWAGQSAWMATNEPAGGFVTRIWQEAEELLP
jgi:nitronate monooxygenase